MRDDIVTTDSDQKEPPLYAAREPIFPRRVKGTFRTLKWWIMAVTLTIYYVAPWIRWDRGPSLPDQAVLVDLAGRRFYFFWIEIWPHEFYFVAGLLIMAGLGLFLFTSALGRVWCGYSCPQTVWTDLFFLVERWIEGDRNARVRLWNRKWDARKTRLRLFKWSVWLVIALVTGGAWVFYYADAPSLLRDLVAGEAPFVAYSSIAILTATTFVFGGFMREQVCIYICPWPRIQAAMLDSESLTVSYRAWRGEPRGKHRKAAGAENLGDCVDCDACVNVCPMGIDIRDGQQLACITCALCIDACDDVMAKIGKPRGLIDYMTLADEERERAGQPPTPRWRHLIRARTILYAALWSTIGAGLVVALFMRTDIGLTVSPVRNPLYVTLSDGSIRNTYDVRLRNMLGESQRFRLSVTSKAPLTINLQGTDRLSVDVPADSTLHQRVYLTAQPGSRGAVARRSDVRLWLENLDTQGRTYRDTIFNGAGK
ncbi:MAG: cytochrome c oxidase accessory protein CcoG [Paracoccaceae bacterium]